MMERLWKRGLFEGRRIQKAGCFPPTLGSREHCWRTAGPWCSLGSWVSLSMLSTLVSLRCNTRPRRLSPKLVEKIK